MTSIPKKVRMNTCALHIISIESRLAVPNLNTSDGDVTEQIVTL